MIKTTQIYFDKLSEKITIVNECQIHYRQRINISPSLHSFYSSQNLKS